MTSSPSSVSLIDMRESDLLPGRRDGPRFPRGAAAKRRDTNQAFISHSPSPPRAKNSRYYICWSRHKPRVYWHFWHYVAYMSRLEVRKRVEIWMVRQAVQ